MASITQVHDPEVSDSEISEDIAVPTAGGRGWLKTHMFRCGSDLCMHAYWVGPGGGQAEVFKASVDFNQLERLVSAYHARLHGQSSVGFLGLDKVVKSIGRNKLVKGISRQIKAVARSPIAAQATRFVPPLDGVRRSVATAANIADARGNLLKAGIRQMHQAVRNNDPKNATVAMAKALPKNIRPQAVSIVRKVYSKALSEAPGGKLAGIGQDALMQITKGAIPSDVKKIAQKAVLARRILQKSGAKNLNSAMPSTPMLMPGVSNRALSAYSGATRAISAMEKKKALEKAASHLRLSKRLPAVEQRIRREQKFLQKARTVLSRLPPERRAKLQQHLAAREHKLVTDVRKLSSAKQALAKQSYLMRQVGPHQIRRTLAQGSAARQYTRRVLAAAQSDNPVVRRRAQQAAAILKAVARSRQAVRNQARNTFGVAGCMRVGGENLLIGCGGRPCSAC